MGIALSAYTSTNYVVFLLLGLSFFPILWKSYEVSSARIRAEQMAGLFESLVPTTRGVESLPFAYLFSSFLGSLGTLGLLLALLSWLLPDGALRLDDPRAMAAFLPLLVLAAVTMWGLGLVMGGLTTVFKEAGPASSLLRILLLVFGGVYLPVSLLPTWGQWLAKALPITYAAEGMRAALTQGATFQDVLVPLCVLAGFAFVTTVGGVWVFRLLLDRARRSGTLYGY